MFANSRIVLASVAVLAALAGAFFWYTQSASDPASGPAAQSTQASPKPGPSGSGSGWIKSGTVQVHIGKPQVLSIPAIDVDAPIVKVGTAPDGSQSVPSTLTDVGWWKHGVTPGMNGNAVIVGHTASRADGVFDKLNKLKVGDTATITGKDGAARFTVTSTREVPVAEFPQVNDEVYRSTGTPGLVLMTCDGWNGERFNTTTIVFAELAKK